MLEWLKIVLPIAAAAIAWLVNEWQKRKWEQYQRKEANYKELLHTLRGFYTGAANDLQLKEAFLDQLTQSWLYCPDNVITLGYQFLDTVGGANVDAIKKESMGRFVAAIRKDLLSQELVKSTSLSAKDFGHYTTT